MVALLPWPLQPYLDTLRGSDRDTVLAFFAKAGGWSGAHEILLQTEPIGDVVLKLDFDSWIWKRVRKRVVG